MQKVTKLGTENGETHRRYHDAEQCGNRYGISSRHWMRLVDAGKAPQPTRFGRSVRWADSVLNAWEADGCREVSKRGRS